MAICYKKLFKFWTILLYDMNIIRCYTFFSNWYDMFFKEERCDFFRKCFLYLIKFSIENSIVLYSLLIEFKKKSIEQIYIHKPFTHYGKGVLERII